MNSTEPSLIVVVVETSANGEKLTTTMYSGPVREATVVFPVGEFHLFAEIHEEAQAFTVFDIDTRFSTIMPTQAEYETIDVDKLVKDSRDTSTASQL